MLPRVAGAAGFGALPRGVARAFALRLRVALAAGLPRCLARYLRAAGCGCFASVRVLGPPERAAGSLRCGAHGLRFVDLSSELFVFPFCVNGLSHIGI